MQADDYNRMEYKELIKALEVAKNVENLTTEEYQDITDFFNDNENMEYNEFLTTYKEKYGNIIKQYREPQKVKAIKTIKFAAILYIITFILGGIGVIVYFAQSSVSSY